MSQLLLKGGRHLDGEVQIQGAKNSVLPILAATLLTGDAVELKNCPRLKDVDASVRILQTLGCDAHWEAEKLTVNAAQLSSCAISDTLMPGDALLCHFPGGNLGPVRPGGDQLPWWVRSVMGPWLPADGKERRNIVRTVSVRTMLLWRG